jgi:hypothetical protein
MRLFGLFGRKKQPGDDGVWLTNEDVREHFRTVGQGGASDSRRQRRQAVWDGDMGRFEALGGTVVDLRPFATNG